MPGVDFSQPEALSMPWVESPLFHPQYSNPRIGSFALRNLDQIAIR